MFPSREQCGPTPVHQGVGGGWGGSHWVCRRKYHFESCNGWQPLCVGDFVRQSGYRSYLRTRTMQVILSGSYSLLRSKYPNVLKVFLIFWFFLLVSKCSQWNWQLEYQIACMLVNIFMTTIYFWSFWFLLSTKTFFLPI